MLTYLRSIFHKFLHLLKVSHLFTSLTLDQKNIVRNLLTLENSEVAKTCEKLLKDEKTLFEF